MDYKEFPGEHFQIPTSTHLNLFTFQITFFFTYIWELQIRKTFCKHSNSVQIKIYVLPFASSFYFIYKKICVGGGQKDNGMESEL